MAMPNEHPRQTEILPLPLFGQAERVWAQLLNAPDVDADLPIPPGSVDAVAENQSLAALAKPLRAVIVEDEAIISMELTMLLEDFGVVVLGTAMTAVDAEALVNLHRPDFLTMDITIKGRRDGIDAAKSIFSAYGIRSIFVSAFGDAETKARAQGAEPFAWISKPVDERELAEAIALVRRKAN
jgi:CheY-like chemotaxis protein